MNKSWWALLVAALAGTVAMAGSAKEFVLVLPQGIDTARRVVLELRDVRLPRKTAVVLRARVIDGGTEASLGSVGLIAESSEAEGAALHASVRIEVTKALQRWRLSHPGAGDIRVRVAPYSGGTLLTHLEWTVEAADLEIITP